jgi:hypothetical protein
MDGAKAIDTHKEALAKNSNVQMDGGASAHDIIEQRVRNKSTLAKNNKVINNSDDMYQNILELKKTGMLPQMLQKAGIKRKHLMENEGVSVSGSAPMGGEAPIAPLGGAMKKIDDCYEVISCKKKGDI